MQSYNTVTPVYAELQYFNSSICSYIIVTAVYTQLQYCNCSIYTVVPFVIYDVTTIETTVKRYITKYGSE